MLWMAEGLLQPCSAMDGMNDCWHAFLRGKNHDKGQKGIHVDEGWSVHSLAVDVRMYDCVIEIMLEMLTAGCVVPVMRNDGGGGECDMSVFAVFGRIMHTQHR